MDRIENWVAGKRLPGSSDEAFEVHDPARGIPIAVVHGSTPADIDIAIDTATVAAAEWATTPLGRRTAILFRMVELARRHELDLARCVTREHGKTLADARGEIARGVETLEYACGLAEHLKGEVLGQVSEGVDVRSVREPLGVVAGITPFNFPVMVPLWMAAPAVASGNSFVLKPSEKDPSPSLLLAELWQEAGLPDGVFTVLHGGRATVEELLEHPGVAAISFVGSTPIARRVYEQATRFGKRVQALGGAKNHLVVAPDADVAQAADAAIAAAYGSAGERCMAISVVVAVGEVAEPLVAELARRARGIRVGPGDEDGIEMGPLVTAAHRDRVQGYLEPRALHGARLVVDGRAFDAQPGYFLGPSLVDDVRPGAPVYDEEIFGPVLSVVRVSELDEAIRLINDNPYANGAALFTTSGATARRFEREVRVGMVGVNVAIPVPVSSFSFGGWRSSLFGDLHVYGPEGFAFCTRQKVITARWPESAPTYPLDLAFPAGTR